MNPSITAYTELQQIIKIEDTEVRHKHFRAWQASSVYMFSNRSVVDALVLNSLPDPETARTRVRESMIHEFGSKLLEHVPIIQTMDPTTGDEIFNCKFIVLGKKI